MKEELNKIVDKFADNISIEKEFKLPKLKKSNEPVIPGLPKLKSKPIVQETA